jgi:hypothetical protein
VAQGCAVEMASPFDKLTIFNEFATITDPGLRGYVIMFGVTDPIGFAPFVFDSILFSLLPGKQLSRLP